jgi:hypothetical protein
MSQHDGHEPDDPNDAKGGQAPGGQRSKPPPKAKPSPNKTLLGMPAPQIDPKAPPVHAPADAPDMSKPSEGVGTSDARSAGKAAPKGKAPRGAKAPGTAPDRKRQATLLGVAAPGVPAPGAMAPPGPGGPPADERPTPEVPTSRELAMSDVGRGEGRPPRPAEEGTQEISVMEALPAEQPPPPPTGDVPASGPPATTPAPGGDAEPPHTVAAPPIAPPTAEPARGSRSMLLGASVLALLLAGGLAVYAATRSFEPPGTPDDGTSTAAAPTTSGEPEVTSDGEPGAGTPEDEGATAAEAEPADEAGDEPTDEAGDEPADEAGDEAGDEPAEDGPAVVGELDVPEVPAAIERLPARVRAKRAARLRSTARRMFRRNRHPQAEALYRKAWQFQPDHAQTAAGIGLTLDRQDQPDRAIAWVRRAIELDPKDGGHHFLLGTMLEGQEDVKGARASYLRAARLDPRDKRPRHRLKKLDK